MEKLYTLIHVAFACLRFSQICNFYRFWIISSIAGILVLIVTILPICGAHHAPVLVLIFYTMKSTILLCLMTITLVALKSDGYTQQHCRMKKIVVTAKIKGCRTLRLVTFGCHGYCSSESSILDHDGVFQRYNCCKPTKHREFMVRVFCPSMKTKFKLIPAMTAAECTCTPCRNNVVSHWSILLLIYNFQ